MKKIKGHVATNKVGSDTSFEFEVDDEFVRLTDIRALPNCGAKKR